MSLGQLYESGVHISSSLLAFVLHLLLDNISPPILIMPSAFQGAKPHEEIDYADVDGEMTEAAAWVSIIIIIAEPILL